MLKLTLKISKAQNRKELSAQVAKLALWIEAGADRGTIVGMTDDPASAITGKWNVSRDDGEDSGPAAAEAP